MTTDYENKVHECIKAYEENIAGTASNIHTYVSQQYFDSPNIEKYFYKGECPIIKDITKQYQLIKDTELDTAKTILDQIKGHIKYPIEHGCFRGKIDLKEATNKIKDKLQELNNNNDQEAISLKLKEIYHSDEHTKCKKLIKNLFENEDVNQKLLYDNIGSLNKAMDDYQSEFNNNCTNYSNNIDHILSYIQVSQTANDIL